MDSSSSSTVGDRRQHLGPATELDVEHAPQHVGGPGDDAFVLAVFRGLGCRDEGGGQSGVVVLEIHARELEDVLVHS